MYMLLTFSLYYFNVHVHVARDAKYVSLISPHLIFSFSPGEVKKRLPPVGAETRPKYVDSSRQYNGLLKRSSFTDGSAAVRGAHGIVTLGSRRRSADAVNVSHERHRDVVGNGISPSTSKYVLPPIV